MKHKYSRLTRSELITLLLDRHIPSPTVKATRVEMISALRAADSEAERQRETERLSKPFVTIPMEYLDSLHGDRLTAWRNVIQNSAVYPEYNWADKQYVYRNPPEDFVPALQRLGIGYTSHPGTA